MSMSNNSRIYSFASMLILMIVCLAASNAFGKNPHFRTPALFAFDGNTASAAGNFTTIDYPGAWGTQLWGNNSAGDIVGGFGDAAGWHGFLLRKGIYTPIDYPGALWTDAYGINPRGDIVGQYGSFDGVDANGVDIYTTHGFLLKDGVFSPVDVTGGENTMPFKISPSGTIVGCNHFNVPFWTGTRWTRVLETATMTGFSLNPFGSVSSTPGRSMNLGINPDGDIVGYSFTTPAGTPSGRAERSYLLRDGVMNWFQYPGAFATLATDISPNGAIVGRYRLASPATFNGFVLFEGQFESFAVPTASNTVPMGVNAKGDIVGYYTVGTGNAAVYHGFIRIGSGGGGLISNEGSLRLSK